MDIERALVRFWEKVEIGNKDECWIWKAAASHGYGQFWNGERVEMAHRFAYRIYVAEIPDNFDVDHVKANGCTTTLCVNYIAHLEAVSHRENCLRGDSLNAINAAKTHCHRGHPLSGDNLYIGHAGSRRCRICHLIDCENGRLRRGITKRASLIEVAPGYRVCSKCRVMKSLEHDFYRYREGFRPMCKVCFKKAGW